MEIAYDLAEGGAKRVRLAVRTPPNIVLRAVGGLPGDPVAIAMLKLPSLIADAPMKLVRRLAIGNLTAYGLPRPNEGLFARLRRDGKAPAIVDKEVIQAIKDRRIEIVAGVESFDQTGVQLADGSRIEPDAIIAATGCRPALERMVGHLGVLDDRGAPLPRAAGRPPPGFASWATSPGQGKSGTWASRPSGRRRPSPTK